MKTKDKGGFPDYEIYIDDIKISVKRTQNSEEFYHELIKSMVLLLESAKQDLPDTFAASSSPEEGKP